MVFYGDSITEALQGTFRGKPDSKVADVPAVWEKHFGTWRALAFGIAGAYCPESHNALLPFLLEIRRLLLLAIMQGLSPNLLSHGASLETLHCLLQTQ